MFIQFRHVEFNEKFYYLPSLVSTEYIKKNHGRGQVTGCCGEKYKGKPLFRNFKKSQIVLVNREKTIDNAWMEVSA